MACERASPLTNLFENWGKVSASNDFLLIHVSYYSGQLKTQINSFKNNMLQETILKVEQTDC